MPDPESSAFKYETDCAGQAKTGVEKNHHDWLAHEEQRKRHKHGPRDHFLADFQLRPCQRRVTDAIGRHLQKILNKHDAQGSRAAIHPGAGLSCFRWP